MFNNEVATTVTTHGAPWLLLATIAMLVGKFTLAPTLPWWLVLLPVYILPAAFVAIVLAIVAGFLVWQLLKALWKLGVFLKNQCARGCN